MKIVIAGPKGAGKSTLASWLGTALGLENIDTDAVLEELYKAEAGATRTCREICQLEGETEFREWETRAIKEAAARDWLIVSTGGSSMLNPDSRRELRREAILILVTAPVAELWQRISAGGIPAYLKSDDPEKEFAARTERLLDVITPYADIVMDTSATDLEATGHELVNRISHEMAIRNSTFSTLGTTLRISTFGESHGPALGAVLDGVPPGVELCEEDIQHELDRRRPGQSEVSTARKESDKVEILSGVFEGKTTGAPIGLLIRNKDQKSSHYDAVKDLFRPGHADFTFWKKYGLRDYRGGGRSSGRETAARTAGGAVAKKILAGRGVTINAYALEIAGIKAEEIDLSVIEKNSVRAPDAVAAEKMVAAIIKAKEAGDSVGGVVQMEVSGLPAGLGDPVFGKLDARLAQAFFSLGAVKGMEIGAGFAAARMEGSENNDNMTDAGMLTNHAGGILGGISTGEKIILRLAIKPTPSISQEQQTCNNEGKNVTVKTEGRHDPCIVPRVVPVTESMAALVILDLWNIQERLRGKEILQ